ncbi:hypothetical protein K435DRAFT_773983 [Dendrothele bispora CBS 962.96]|uniref:Uncharacterized protein n=1 Tax=Dendrothele bispora (strain CBS 962.96) TaxID=1314807 RepID=A0A4S8MQP8_DENBC|nr:hypothetical protein K435DRAFT_773983 [Dendrothele bispora CBS 962.96]
MSQQHQKQFEDDLKQGVEKVMRETPGMNVVEAMQQVTKDMLANNPFVPPEGCPINDLPNELLAHIFYVGMVMEEESFDEEDEDDEDDEDEDEEEDDFESTDDDSEWEDDDSDEDALIGSSSKQKKYTRKRKEASVKEGSGESEDEENEEDKWLPFQVLVSHVCRHWREVAIDTPNLWTTVAFAVGVPPDQPLVWIERSKGHPLDITIDCTSPDPDIDDIEEQIFTFDHNGEPVPMPVSVEDIRAGIKSSTEWQERKSKHMSVEDVSKVLDVIVPNVDRWRTLDVTSEHYDVIYTVLERLSQCPGAPLLEILQLYHYEECEEFDHFSPPELSRHFVLFNGNAPNLKDLALWGVHIDWDGSLSYLRGLRDFELAYHAHDVRPSFETFAAMIHASPELHTLSLCLSGPAGTKEDWGTSQQIEIPSLQELALCHHEPSYIESLLPYLVIPNVVTLNLEFDSGDYTDFAKMLATPLPGRPKSILAGLEKLKIGALPSNKKAREQMLEQLANLHTINLNCCGDEEEFFDKLMETKPNLASGVGGQTVVYCPNLKRIMTAGIDGKKMRKFVETRKAAGVPIARVSMSEEDELEDRERKWLEEHLEQLEFFEPSDSEEEVEIEGHVIELSDAEMDDDDD